jgi:hypothetical protein
VRGGLLILFISKTPVLLRTKSLIVDLASRRGEPNQESPSPYRGQLTAALSQFNTLSDYDGYFIDVLAQQIDYNADKQCPQDCEYDPTYYNDSTRPTQYNPSVGGTPMYLRRLEDIPEDWVTSYLTNAIIAAKKNKKDSVQAYSSKHRVGRTFVDDDEEETTEAELVTENQNDYSPKEIMKAKEKIPYLLRRLHDKSKEMKVHLISMIIATEKAQRDVDLQNRRDSTTKNVNLQPMRILKHDVYKMNPDGTIGPRFGADANKNDDRFKAAWAWRRDGDYEKDPYYNDMVNLLHYYNVMGINIREEDPFTYQEDFISSLTVLYITSNRDYVLRKHRGFHKEVYEALRTLPLEVIENSSAMSEFDKDDMVLNTVNIYNDSVFLKNEYKFRLGNLTSKEATKFAEEMEMFMVYYNLINQEKINMSKIITIDGFFYLDNETPLLLKVSNISKERNNSSFIDLTGEALFNENGYLVKLSDGHKTEFLDVAVAVDYLSDVYQSRQGIGFGRWEGLSI